MSLWSHREEPPEAREARDLSQRISHHADVINERLAHYKKSRDPFAAMMADMYNLDQISRIYRGRE